jgi:predicted P-loop ATPase
MANGGVAEGKEPIGKRWGLDRLPIAEIEKRFRENHGAGVGVCLGPERGPQGSWLIDLECDGPKGSESLAVLLGGPAATLGWSSARGAHALFITHDGERLLKLLAGAQARPGKQAGVFKLDQLPDLEIRVGGYNRDQTVKQLQAVVPPTPGTDGTRRQWNGVWSIAELPDHAYAFLEALAERQAIKAADRANDNGKPFTEPADNGSVYDGLTTDERRLRYVNAALKDITEELARVPRGEQKRHPEGLRLSLSAAGLWASGLCSEAHVRDALMEGFKANRFHEDSPSEVLELIAWAFEHAQPRENLPDFTEPPRPKAQRQRGTQGEKGGNGQAAADEKDESKPIMKSGTLQASCVQNTVIWLSKQPEIIRLDTFNNEVTINGQDLKDEDYTGIQCRIEASLRVPWHLEHVRNAVEFVAAQDPYNPLCDWLNSLQWDGVPRIDDVFSDCFGCEKTAYTKTVARVFFLSAAARGLDPGAQADYMPVLISKQGTFKSSAVAALVPDREWYTDDLGADIVSKDAAQSLRGKWLIEFGEFVRINRSTVDAVKAFLTRRVDHYRAPYARSSADYPRQCVFVGTTNNPQPLLDDENRRFLPLHCGVINIEYIEKYRDQLWAEAVFRYRAGENRHVDDSNSENEVTQEVKEKQEEARLKDDYDGQLEQEFGTYGEVTVEDLLLFFGHKHRTKDDNEVTDPLPRDRWTRSLQIRVGQSMLRIGFESKRQGRGNSKVRVWKRPQGWRPPTEA